MTDFSALFIAPSAYRLGGMQIWLHDLVSHLEINTSWRVKLALVSGKHHCIDSYIKSFPGLPVVPVENKTGSVIGRRIAISRLLRDLNPDLAVGVNIADLYLGANHAKPMGFGGKVVMTLHGIASDLTADAMQYSQFIDAAIATNRLSCGILKDKTAIPEERILYAPYGVDTSYCSSQPGFKRVNENGPLRIAWVGRVEQDQKRVWDLIPILNELDKSCISYHLSIAGHGPEFGAIDKVLTPWIGKGRVTVLGAISSQQLQSQVYDTHQVLLITSSWETGPIVAWEAMASGLVVVSSSYIGSGLENALQHNHNCLLYPVGDPVGAARAILRLIDPATRDYLAFQGRILVQDRYSKEASNTSWVQALETVVRLPSLPWVDTKIHSSSSGRLDRLLGIRNAERLRQCLGSSYVHRSPGSEWPHTSNGHADDQELFQFAKELDRRA